MVEYTMIEREAGALQQPVPLEQIEAMCQRAFGKGRALLSVKELGGGGHNNTYRVQLADMEPVILRVSPERGPRLAHYEVDLMRNEQYAQPFLAPIAPLLPKTLMIDFTHQLLGRDYIFQTFMPGELWSDIENELAMEEDLDLYRQMGEIARLIHDVEGETFGQPARGHTFDSWSAQVFHTLEHTIKDIEAARLDASDMRALLTLARDHQYLLDEVRRPHLLHGDLWTFNLLVRRGGEKQPPTISAVLDSDRCWWGDPLADWTMFLLRIKGTESLDPKVVAGTRAFWQTYSDQGVEPSDSSSQFRLHVYYGMSFGAARLELHRRPDHDRVRQTYLRLQEILEFLHTII
ncbi:phosphotransferase family protein [Dictyobacter aurantiacus]|uniref:Aminoglycoside phosphotransferase domain-containing protein n=1 Tax=Dictyobacter aurantiacus TaxID=1936993 RepID=A0A401ZIQ2_9CHLR|nr:aminoglycoside phosphotransferase family protein [Dictyobacter aurantiacus]GCE06727.1 hypothetical protein KDAU_40560 [Dictyobacter aurantiacus]